LIDIFSALINFLVLGVAVPARRQKGFVRRGLDRSGVLHGKLFGVMRGGIKAGSEISYCPCELRQSDESRRNAPQFE